MRREKIAFRLTAVAAITGLSASFLPIQAWAQQAPPAPPPSDQANPPTRVGALTRVQGVVSFHAAGADSWSPASVNYPVTTGEGFWTQPAAEARIDVSDSDLVMASGTELEVGDLDPTTMVATVPQGEVYLQVRNVGAGETYTLVTPRGAMTITGPGQYDVVAGDTGTPTRITVLAGGATLSEGADASLAAGQAAEITGDAAPFQVQIVPASQDPFVEHVLAEERPPPPPPAAVPPQVAQMPGGAELQEYGTWTPSPQYGDVWYPQVAPGWVPYREGSWSYVAPWGWTWVDSDPWGFAPFHYGRWIQYGGRWGWVPGSAVVVGAPVYPVYAPALVTFFGVGVAVGVTAALLSSGSVGWVPLGPGEVYRPWFHAGPGYIRDVNIRHVTNLTQITNVNNNITINRFRNAAGATVVPASAMAASRPIRGLARTVNAQTLAQARPVFGRQPITPTTATVGITPAIARAVHAAPAPAGAAPRMAPGPAIRAQAAAPPGTPGGQRRVEVPPLARSAGAPRAGIPAGNAAPRPEVNAAPGRPGATVPTLRAPGEAPPSSRPAEQRQVGTPPLARPSGPAGVPALRAPGATPPAHPLEERGPEARPETPRAPGAPPETPRAPGLPAPGPRPTVEAPRGSPTPHPEVARPAQGPVPGQPARAPAEVRPAPARPAAPEIRPSQRPAAPVVHAPARPAAPAFHPAPAPRPMPAPRPAAPPRPAPAPRPAPVARPAPAPRPAPAARPAPAPRPAPAARPAPAPRPAARPAPHEEKRP